MSFLAVKHWPFIAAAYGATLAMAAYLAISAAGRLAGAKRRLAALDQRPRRVR